MGETIKIDPRGFRGPSAASQQKADTERRGDELTITSKVLDIEEKKEKAP